VVACRPRQGGDTRTHGQPDSCTIRRGVDDPRLEQPLCPAGCFHYTGAILWNAHAPAMWHRFALALRRYVARSTSLQVAELRNVLTVSLAKVAECQRRNRGHFHAVIRFDGPGSPTASRRPERRSTCSRRRWIMWPQRSQCRASGR
jgi:hypothetical protein